MDKTIIGETLAKLGTPCRVEYFETISSTNDLAKELASNGAEENTVVIAEHQTSGRGRLGRSFYSPNGTGLYFSIILRGDFEAQDALMITPACAVAVSDVLINEYEINAQIKWVNDIYINNRKVCGILTESSFKKDGKLDWAVVGIGINLTEPRGGFPDDIASIAGTLFKENTQNKEALCASVISRVISICKTLKEKDFLVPYRERQFLMGKSVILPSGEEVCVTGIDNDCALVVKHHDGSESAITSGEVSVKLKNV